MRINQRPGIRVGRILNNIFRRPDFHQIAFVNDGNPVTQIPGGGKAVGYKEKSCVEFLADFR